VVILLVAIGVYSIDAYMLYEWLLVAILLVVLVAYFIDVYIFY
jgi:hypothetical protein